MSGKPESEARAQRRLLWILIALVSLTTLVGVQFELRNKAADRQARPEYYAHIEKFGSPLSVREASAYLNSIGYEDLDLSHTKGPTMIPEGWLLGMVFKSMKNPNDELHWFIKSGKRGLQDIQMYPGSKYPIPIYP